MIKTFNVTQLDFEDDFVLGGKITAQKERALSTTAFGMVADDISRIQGTDGIQEGANHEDPNESI